MTPGPHDYTGGTRAALYAFSQRTCYFPDCNVPVVRFVGDEPVINVEIAHIRGALPDAARYEESMSDDERRAFPNLILLCVPHHKTIDRLHPEDYSADDLTRWKREHEGTDGTATLAGITEDRLVQLIEEAVRSKGIERRVDLELAPGIAMKTATFTIHGDRPGEFFDLYRDIGIPLLCSSRPGTRPLLTPLWQHMGSDSSEQVRRSRSHRPPMQHCRQHCALEIRSPGPIRSAPCTNRLPR